MSTASAAAPRFLRRPAARPDELLAAALAVFGERGFRQTTLEEVATRAGVSKGTVYLYFASKDDLFRAVVEQKVITLLVPAEEMARDHTGTAAELLTKMVHLMWDAMARKEMVCLGRLIQSELTQFPEVRQFYFENVIQRNRRLLHSIAGRGVASGEFRREATTIIPRMLPPLVMQLNQFSSQFGDLDRAAPSMHKLRDAMLLMVLDGVRQPASRPRAATARRKTKRG